MMGRRMGRPGLLGTVARTAVIAGTAQAVSGNVARRQHARWEAQQASAVEAVPQHSEHMPAAPPASADPGDLIGQLKQLADLKAAGVLDDAEFAAAKARLLGG